MSFINFPKNHFLAEFQERPVIMGVVNVTPDSFSDGGKFVSVNKAIEHGLKLIEDGADILDIGGESTRPGAEALEISEEIDRIVPVIEGLAGKVKWISIDSRNAATMRAAIKVGAKIVNDVSALSYDDESVSVVAEADIPVILMHAQGNPVDMQKNPNYNNVVSDVFEYLKKRILFCETHRIDASMIVVDPGIGFGKTLEHNLLTLRNIKKFHDLGVPILLGTSRKSFIEKICGAVGVDDRIGGSLSSALWGYGQGVQMFRVHDVLETRQAFAVYDAISSEGKKCSE